MKKAVLLYVSSIILICLKQLNFQSILYMPGNIVMEIILMFVGINNFNEIMISCLGKG